MTNLQANKCQAKLTLAATPLHLAATPYIKTLKRYEATYANRY